MPAEMNTLAETYELDPLPDVMSSGIAQVIGRRAGAP
jgi:hypothetical protein